MPSPPLVPHADTALTDAEPAADAALIDAEHLARMTFGDRVLLREVLELFLRQSVDLMERLSASPADAAATAHTLKGSALGVGAFSVAECAGRLEFAAENGRLPAVAFDELKHTLAATIDVIRGLLRQP